MSDFDAGYRRDVGPGSLGLRLYATRLLQFNTQQSATAPVLKFAGVNVAGSAPQAFPKWRATLSADYSWKDWGVTLSEQYIGKMTLGIPGSPQNFLDDNVDAVWYTDLSVRYDLHPGGRKVQLFAADSGARSWRRLDGRAGSRRATRLPSRAWCNGVYGA